MKRIASIVMTAMLLVILSVSAVFAGSGDLKLVDSSPVDGNSKVQATNVMVKLFFNEEISAEDTQKANKDVFVIKDKKGKKIPFDIFYNKDDASNVNLMIKDNLKEDVSYNVIIDGSMTSDSGDTAGEDIVLKFATKKVSNTGYLLLMGAMIVVMMVTTIKGQKPVDREADLKAEWNAIQTNPYKLAKERNISVEEAQRLINEDKARIQKKAEKVQKAIEKEKPAEPEKKVYKVRTKRITKMHK